MFIFMLLAGKWPSSSYTRSENEKMHFCANGCATAVLSRVVHGFELKPLNLSLAGHIIRDLRREYDVWEEINGSPQS